MKKLFHLILLILLLVMSAFSQENNVEQSNVYKKTKVKLTNGAVLSINNLQVSDSTLEYSNISTRISGKIDLNDVQEVAIPTKSYTGVGFLIVTAIGGVTMLIVENKFEEPKTETTTESGYGWTSTTTNTITKEMAPGPKIAIVAGGALLGTLIGSAIKGGWKNIYPAKDDKVSFNILTDCDNNPYACLQIRF